MQVMTNNTPLRYYLVFLQYETILRELFTHLLVPQAVVEELQQPKTPARVRTWMAAAPCLGGDLPACQSARRRVTAFRGG